MTSTSRQKRWTLVATIIASAMTFIDGTVVNVALPALQADLHARSPTFNGWSRLTRYSLAL